MLLHNTANWKYGRKQLFWVPCPASSRAPSSGATRCPSCRAGLHTGTTSTPCSGCPLPSSSGCCCSGRCTCCCCGCISSASRRCTSNSSSSCSRRSARSCGPSSGGLRQPAALSFFGVQTGPTASRRRCLLGVSASAKRSRHLCRTCCSRGTCSRGRSCTPGCRCFCRLPSGNLPGCAVPAAAGNGRGRPNLRPEQDDLLPCRSARRGPRHRQLFLHVGPALPGPARLQRQLQRQHPSCGQAPGRGHHLCAAPSELHHVRPGRQLLHHFLHLRRASGHHLGSSHSPGSKAVLRSQSAAPTATSAAATGQPRRRTRPRCSRSASPTCACRGCCASSPSWHAGEAAPAESRHVEQAERRTPGRPRRHDGGTRRGRPAQQHL